MRQDGGKEFEYRQQGVVQSVLSSLTLRMVLIVKALFGHFEIVIGKVPKECFGFGLGSGIIVILKECGHTLDQAM